ncbi:heat shock protein, partial [Choanephora cucurbitarum]
TGPEQTPQQTNTEEKQLDTTDTQEKALTQTDGQWWMKERVQSSFSRSFSFPTPINAENIKASFNNGILEIVVPKTTEDQTKRIDIQ